MKKINASQILVKHAKLEASRLNARDKKVTNLIKETKNRQAEVLRLKDVDHERLRMIVQL